MDLSEAVLDSLPEVNTVSDSFVWDLVEFDLILRRRDRTDFQEFRDLKVCEGRMSVIFDI